MKHAISLTILLIISCGLYSQMYFNTIDGEDKFKQFAGLPLSAKYGQVSAVKLVYHLEQKESYYINSLCFKYHNSFCEFHFEHDLDLNKFNKANYTTSPDRKYLLGNINYYSSLDIYALELSPVDLMDKEYILQLYNVVCKTTFIENLHLLLNSSRLQSLRGEFENKVPILDPSDIYKNLNYQAIAKYKNCGTLRFINDLSSKAASIDPMDIAVINETPLFLPKVSGIIVNEFQTPLSHLTILGQNRKIPIAAYKQAFEDSSLLKFNKQKVCLEVLCDTFKIYTTDKLEELSQHHKPIKLKYDLGADSVINIEHVNKRSFKYVGNKAANFGTLHKLSLKNDFMVPECSFVIPFYFYNEHINNSNARLLIDNLLSQKNKMNDDSIKATLKAIRKEIKMGTIDTDLIKSVNSTVIANGKYTRLRFRSSTNAEDTKGFSGAGLYTSKTGILNDNKKSFEKAIKTVWASLWSYEAFSEREYYSIDHNNVYMGILVHRSFPNEKVNGVSITKNLYRPDSFGFVVNAQIGNENVVKPKRGIISDQFICYPDIKNDFYKDKNTIDIITKSSINNNELVMNETEIQNLANQLETIKKYYINRTLTTKTYLEFGLDIEFKLDGNNRDLYIKQVRIYND